MIIPTCGRPEYLPRAVASALAGMEPGAVEVIVVPNGPDESWRAVLAAYPSVKVMPVPVRHANVARNHGLRNASGKYVRFLDDDDFLYADGARRQCDALERGEADVCSGAFDVVDKNMTVLTTIRQADTVDLISALFWRDGMWQPTAHVFRRSAIMHLAWDERLPWCQDFDWLLKVALIDRLRWIRCDWTVGAWHRHLGERISMDSGPEEKRRVVADRVISAVDLLEGEGRLTRERREAAAACLWNGVHAALCFSPRYWTRVARRASELAPGSHPQIPLYDLRWARPFRLDPLLWEWMMLPRRRLAWWFRRVRRASGLARHD
ncbi:MAG: glycosyltransferase family 2 protein [Pseudomonadota bacterium]